MADSMISSAATDILNKVVSLAANEIGLAWGFKKDLATLRRSLEMIQAVVRDAERQQLTSDAVKIWVKNLKDVADKAETVLDEIAYEILRRKVETKVSSIFSSSNSLVFRPKMAHKIKDINTSLAQINKQADEYNLQRQSADTIQVIQNQNEETDSFLDEFSVIGRDDDASVLIETLIGSSNEEKLTIIPIVGMGGLGKTTLAKLIFNNERVDKHFSVKIWVCVAVEVDVKTLLGQILESHTRKKEEVQTRDSIIRSLKEKLGGKKYLLVLDDVWNEEGAHWDDFRSCMLKVNEGRGNSIIVTTRSKKLASNAQALSMRPLGQLSDDMCWSIIQERAFAAGGPSKTPDMVDIGKDIAKKCGGVPLVAKVVGGMLRSKKGRDGWLSVQSNAVWDFEEGDRVLRILKLSFDNLPNLPLQQCFAYCSIFQKDAVMYKEKLIQLWMALGFLQADEARNKDMEDVGHDFFRILVQNSLFQDVEKDDYDNITGCKMHDLVHDLALSLSKSECFNSEASTSNDTIPQVQHIALYSERGRMFSELQEKEKARYLHTLFLGYGNVPKSLLLKFKCLRILDLSRSSLERLPDSIGKLIHLRYLDLSKNDGVKVLPKSIGRLYHLQTLDLQGCKYLKELPNEVRNLINLRHLYIDVSCKLPLGVGKFTCLRSLSYFRVGRGKGRGIKELGCLRNLGGGLELLNLEEVSNKEEAQSADLVGKGNLYGLKYVWSDEREGSKAEDKEVLDGLQAPPNLKTLKIEGFMGDNFPEWLLKTAVSIKGKWRLLQNLVDIRLYNCRRCEHVPMLGQVPFLQTLVLEGMSNVKCIDSLFYGINYDTSTSSGGGGGVSRSKLLFPALRSFRIKNMEKLETWMDASATTRGGINRVEVFPCLEELTIMDCSGLTSLPSGLLGSCTSLSTLEISECSGLTSLPSGLLGSCTSLRELHISDCSNLMTLPELHNQSHSLQQLIITGCLKLGCFPEGYFNVLKELWIGPMSEDPQFLKLSLQAILCNSNVKLSLRSLHLKGRSEWESIPEEVQHLTALTFIALDEFGSVEALPDWFANLSFLEHLYLFRCRKLKSLPSMEAMHRLTKLERIEIIFCPLLKERVAEGSGPEWSKIAHIPIRDIPSYREVIDCGNLSCSLEGLSNLIRLEVPSLSLFSQPPQEEVSLVSLRTLELTGSTCSIDATTAGAAGRMVFRCLEYLSITKCTFLIDDFWSARLTLKRLVIYDCPNLKTIPTLQGFTSLEELEIADCSGLTSLPSGIIGSCTSVRVLHISDCPNLMTLPELHNQSHSLQQLIITRCEKLGCLPEGYLSNLNVLKELSIGPMSENPQFLKLSLQVVLRNSNVKLSLRELSLRGRSEWESIPKEVQHLTALTSISLYEFGSVEALPNWFANLSSLEELGLYCCEKLKSLPSMEAMQRLTKLESIDIIDCPLLEERVAEGSGPEWSKIAHIPYRYIPS